MQKEKKILLNYILYFATFLLTCIIGITGIFAYSYEDIGYFNDKTQLQVEVNYASSPFNVPINATYQLEQVYSIDMFLGNINLSPDYVYFFEIYLPNTILTKANMAQVFNQSGSTQQECTVLTTYFSNNYPHVTFKCNSSTNITSLYIKYFNSNNQYLFEPQIFTWNYSFMRKRVPEENDNTGEIIDGIQQSTQDIVNNQNENTKKIEDTINDNLNDCHNSLNLFNLRLLNGTGSSYATLVYQDNILKISNNSRANGYVNTGKKLSELAPNLKVGDVVYLYLDTNFSGKSIYVGEQWLNNQSKTITQSMLDSNIIVYGGYNQTTNLKLQITKDEYISSYEPYGEEICFNKLDEQNKTSKGILAKLKDLFDTLFSDEEPDISGLNNMVGWLPPGPVDSIINLPLALFNSLTNTLTGTCRPVSLTIPFVNQTLVLPCFDAYMSQYLTGFNTLWTLVGTILSVFILYYYLLSLYKWVDDTLTFRENNLPGYYGDNWGGGA